MVARGRVGTTGGPLLYRSLSARRPARCSFCFHFPLLLSRHAFEALLARERAFYLPRCYSLRSPFPLPRPISLLFSFCLYPLVITTFRWYQIDQTRRALTTCRVWLCPGCSQASLHWRSTSFRVQPPLSSPPLRSRVIMTWRFISNAVLRLRNTEKISRQNFPVCLQTNESSANFYQLRTREITKRSYSETHWFPIFQSIWREVMESN